MCILYVSIMFLNSVYDYCTRIICIVKKMRCVRILDNCLNFPLKSHDVNIVFTCHYLKFIYSMRTYINLWLVRLIVHHPAGCGRLLALCVCLSVCICVLAIMTPRSNAKSQPQRIVWLNGPKTCNTFCVIMILKQYRSGICLK